MKNSMVLPVMLWVIFSGGVIYGSMHWLLHLADGGKTVVVLRKKNVLGGLSFGNAIVIAVICGMEPGETFAGGNRYLYLAAEGILLSLLAGGLLAAACMDEENCYVYNYVWWWCLLWTGILLGVSCGGANTATAAWRYPVPDRIRQAAAVAVFAALQQYLFARMYGRADSHAFSVCALISCRWQGEMLWFLIHMLLALALLAVVQLWKGNVTRKGTLRTPKPFIPYIIVIFWAEIVWMLCLQGG